MKNEFNQFFCTHTHAPYQEKEIKLFASWQSLIIANISSVHSNETEPKIENLKNAFFPFIVLRDVILPPDERERKGK